jgi:hypothetical protein
METMAGVTEGESVDDGQGRWKVTLHQKSFNACSRSEHFNLTWRCPGEVAVRNRTANRSRRLLAQLGNASEMQQGADRRVGVGIGVGFIQGLAFGAEGFDQNVSH